MVLIILEMVLHCRGRLCGFRPLAGIMVLIDLEALEMCYDDVQFPSPCGDYGSYRNTFIKQYIQKLQFPSPCGDYGSYQTRD